jgi:DNA adenine methylase
MCTLWMKKIFENNQLIINPYGSMKYMWSKNRIAKYLLPIILKDRNPWQWYVEPFVWWANMIDKVEWDRIWADLNEYLISLLNCIQINAIPEKITKQEYEKIKYSFSKYPKSKVWYAWICASYSWKWFWWFAGTIVTKNWNIRDYQDEAIKNLINQKQKIKWVKFINSSYKDLQIPDNSIIYCDPPYKNTTKYKDNFNHEDFYNWCREKKKEGHTIFISEYNMPDDFTCVWQMEVKSSLSANWKSWWSKKSIEKLFTL